MGGPSAGKENRVSPALKLGGERTVLSSLGMEEASADPAKLMFLKENPLGRDVPGGSVGSSADLKTGGYRSSCKAMVKAPRF